jgi:hypothetical protein
MNHPSTTTVFEPCVCSRIGYPYWCHVAAPSCAKMLRNRCASWRFCSTFRDSPPSLRNAVLTLIGSDMDSATR